MGLSWHTFLGDDPSPLDLMCLGFPRSCYYQYSLLEWAPQSQYHMPLSRPTHMKKKIFEDHFCADGYNSLLACWEGLLKPFTLLKLLFISPKRKVQDKSFLVLSTRKVLNNFTLKDYTSVLGSYISLAVTKSVPLTLKRPRI